MHKILLVATVSGFLLACSDEGEKEANRARGDHAFERQVEAVDKAKKVDELIDKTAQRRRDAANQ